MNTPSIENPIISTDASSYAQVFDSTNPNWERNPEYNLLFIKVQENYMNDILQARGHVFLNDVHDCLGLKRTSAGALVGWLSNGKDDNHVDFNMQDFQKESTPFVQLNFNVAGIIYDKI